MTVTPISKKATNRLMEDTPDTGQFMTWGKTAQDFITQNGPQFKTQACILSSVKQIASPGWMHETSARGWCTRMTQRDGMGREVGAGFRMRNTCKSMADSHQCMAKPTTTL